MVVPTRYHRSTNQFVVKSTITLPQKISTLIVKLVIWDVSANGRYYTHLEQISLFPEFSFWTPEGFLFVKTEFWHGIFKVGSKDRRQDETSKVWIPSLCLRMDLWVGHLKSGRSEVLAHSIKEFYLEEERDNYTDI